jgi:nitrate/nitrite transporter NarK
MLPCSHAYLPLPSPLSPLPLSPLPQQVLALACLIMFGPYYCYDNPEAIKKQLTLKLKISEATCTNVSEKIAFTTPPPIDAIRYHNFTKCDTDANNVKYNLLYTVYSIPNIILPFFGGYFVDILGTNTTLFTFLTLITIGQGIFTLATWKNSYVGALAGRVVFGLGGESMSVAATTLLALWFRGKETALAMGVNLSVSRLGTVVNNQVSPAALGSSVIEYDISPPVANAEGNFNPGDVTLALFLGFIICIISVLATITLIFIERFAARKNRKSIDDEPDYDEDIPDTELVYEIDYNDLSRENSVFNSPLTPAPKGPDLKQEEPKEVVSLSDVRHFQLSFWLIAVSCVVVYGAVLPFNNVAADLLQDKFGYSVATADRYASIPFFISACTSPFLGGIVDRWGKRAILLTVSAACLSFAHILLAFFTINPALALSIIGLSYAVYAAAIWPSVPFVVEEHQLGTAYGVVTAVQNGGLAAFPIVVGAIKDAAGSYKYVSLFFASVGAAGVLVGLFLNVIDRRNGDVLNRARVAEPAEVTNESPEYSASDDEYDDAPPIITTNDPSYFIDDEQSRTQPLLSDSNARSSV